MPPSGAEPSPSHGDHLLVQIRSQWTGRAWMVLEGLLDDEAQQPDCNGQDRDRLGPRRPSRRAMTIATAVTRSATSASGELVASTSRVELGIRHSQTGARFPRNGLSI